MNRPFASVVSSWAIASDPRPEVVRLTGDHPTERLAPAIGLPARSTMRPPIFWADGSVSVIC